MTSQSYPLSYNNLIENFNKTSTTITKTFSKVCYVNSIKFTYQQWASHQEGMNATITVKLYDSSNNLLNTKSGVTQYFYKMYDSKGYDTERTLNITCNTNNVKKIDINIVLSNTDYVGMAYLHANVDASVYKYDITVKDVYDDDTGTLRTVQRGVYTYESGQRYSFNSLSLSDYTVVGNTNFSGYASSDTVISFNYKIKYINYNITYVLFEGINNESNPGIYSAKNDITLLPPTRSCYIFEGWFLDEKFNIPIETTAGASGDLILYAKWKREPSKVVKGEVYDIVANHPLIQKYTSGADIE